MLIGEGTSDIQKMIIGRSLLKDYKLALKSLSPPLPVEDAPDLAVPPAIGVLPRLPGSCRPRVRPSRLATFRLAVFSGTQCHSARCSPALEQRPVEHRGHGAGHVAVALGVRRQPDPDLAEPRTRVEDPEQGAADHPARRPGGRRCAARLRGAVAVPLQEPAGRLASSVRALPHGSPGARWSRSAATNAASSAACHGSGRWSEPVTEVEGEHPMFLSERCITSVV